MSKIERRSALSTVLVVGKTVQRSRGCRRAAHIDKNFVDWFPVWDIVFRTAYRSCSGECPATGVRGVHVKTLRDAYLLPVKGWTRLMASRSTRRTA
jgi:hypothetical protein